MNESWFQSRFRCKWGELGESVGHETSQVLGSSPALADVHDTISLQLFYAVKSEIDL
jgi:hypothetical protein